MINSTSLHTIYNNRLSLLLNIFVIDVLKPHLRKIKKILIDTEYKTVFFKGQRQYCLFINWFSSIFRFLSSVS